MTRRFRPTPRSESGSAHDALVLVLLGPPGVGKGTQGRLLADAEGIPLLSTGDILRGAVREGTPLGRQAQDFMRAGELVPDQLIDDMMADRLAQSDAARGFILDGYPRTVAQVQALDVALEAAGRPLSLAVLFEVADEEVVRRLAGRRSCQGCGRAYHVEFDPPRERAAATATGSSSSAATTTARRRSYTASTSTAARPSRSPTATARGARCCPSTRRETRTRCRPRCARRWRSTLTSPDRRNDDGQALRRQGDRCNRSRYGPGAGSGASIGAGGCSALTGRRQRRSAGGCKAMRSSATRQTPRYR